MNDTKDKDELETAINNRTKEITDVATGRKFKIKKWTFSESLRFGSRFLKIAQELFNKADPKNVANNSINWGALLGEHDEFIMDVVVTALRPNFDSIVETRRWVEANVDFFINGIPFIAEIFLLNFPKISEVEGARLKKVVDPT